MAQYATAAELASFLQQDVDTSSANLVLQVASERFAKAADTRFESTAVTYQTEGGIGNQLVLPYWPIISIAAVRVAGVVVTDYTRIKQFMYRTVGWGVRTFPPQLIEVDLTHGYTSAPDDVKGAVLDTAAQAYRNPDMASSESIDDYAVRFATSAGGLQLTDAAAATAAYYKGPLVA